MIERRGGMGWTCVRCGEWGDALDMVSWSLAGCRARNAGPRFRDVVAWASGDDLAESAAAVEAAPDDPLMTEAEVSETLRGSTRAGLVPDVARYLATRGADPDRAPAVVLRPDMDAEWWPRGRLRRWPIVIPAFTGTGTVAGLHGARIDRSVDPKTLWARRRRASGLLFADPVRALPWLRGGPAPMEVFVTEGATDYLAAASRADVAVLGVESGSASAFRLLRWHASAVVYCATDDDAIGERYAAAIRDNVPSLVKVMRVRAGAVVGGR